MKTYFISNSNVEVGITEKCGQLFPAKFFFGEEIIEPMHIAPWVNEKMDPSIPPMLKNLKGDFFCAPFGDCDLLENETRAHGSSANDLWNKIEATKYSMKFKLSKKILGAELFKEITIREDESIIYQKHTFKGGMGNIPIGHHAMLKVKSQAFISFSDFIYGATPSKPVEPDSQKGRSILKYPQKFSDLNFIQLADGSLVDASIYPFEHDHEDLYMIISSRSIPFGWSALSCPKEGWLWFSIKNINLLPNTVIWLSNGGRYYPPFSSRHHNVIGIEETASYFHLGHKASINVNKLNMQGLKTCIELNQHRIFEIPYLFGIAQIPKNFGKVRSITEISEGIQITDYYGNTVNSKVNMNFIKDLK